MPKISSFRKKTAKIAPVRFGRSKCTPPLLKCLGPSFFGALFSKRFVNASGVNVSLLNNFPMIIMSFGSWTPPWDSWARVRVAFLRVELKTCSKGSRPEWRWLVWARGIPMEWSIIDGDELEPVRFQQNEQMSNTKKKLQFAPSLVNQWLLDPPLDS